MVQARCDREDEVIATCGTGLWSPNQGVKQDEMDVQPPAARRLVSKQ